MKACPYCLGTGKVSDDFGAELRHRRKARGWTLRDLARLVGVTHVHLGHIERGTRQPSQRLRANLMRLLGM